MGGNHCSKLADRSDEMIGKSLNVSNDLLSKERGLALASAKELNQQSEGRELHCQSLMRGSSVGILFIWVEVQQRRCRI